jgi:hypothetical protein
VNWYPIEAKTKCVYAGCPIKSRADLFERAGEFNIILEDVSYLTFGKVTAAVEQKVVAQQEAERAKYIR